MKKFFQSVTSLEDLKKQFRKLALKHHPDKEGGSEKDFIDLKNEYDQLVKENQFGNTKETMNFKSELFKQIIEELINYEIDLEIIGTWIWITGNTYEAKAKIKELGFKWASKKKAWYFHEEPYKKFGKKEYTLAEIRQMHDSQKVKTNRKAALGL